jgi:hypothetical protein
MAENFKTPKKKLFSRNGLFREKSISVNRQYQGWIPEHTLSEKTVEK